MNMINKSVAASGSAKLNDAVKASVTKVETETPAQKQAAAKLALRKQLEKTLLQVRIYFFNRGRRGGALMPLLLLGPTFFPNYSFFIHHSVNWNDLLTHAMASNFTPTWQ
jgi:hypothetical protein